MRDLLNLILSCNSANPTKLESSLRVFHWFIIEEFLVFNEENKEIKIKQDNLINENKKLQLFHGDKQYIVSGDTKFSICDGVYIIGDDNSRKIMVEIKVANSANKKDENEARKQLESYINNICSNNTSCGELLYLIFHTENGVLEYTFVGKDVAPNWKTLKTGRNDNFNWLESLKKVDQERIFEFLDKRQKFVFRYEGLYSGLLALYIDEKRKNKESLKMKNNDKEFEIYVKNIGVEVNYESREKYRSRDLRNMNFSKTRQADLFITDHDKCGYIIEVKKAGSINKGQMEHYLSYVRLISTGKVDGFDQSIFAYVPLNTTNYLNEIYIYSNKQFNNNENQITNVRLLYALNSRKNLAKAFRNYYKKESKNTIRGLAEELGKNIIVKEYECVY